MMRVVHLLSTYNEKENIGPMIDYLLDQEKTLPKYEYIILVADSASSDGTQEIVKDYIKKHKNVHLLETPRGLGISLINGYKYAINELKADVVIPNDVDFQWPPRYIPAMLEKIEEGYDVVVASRHAPGGGDNFSKFRKLTHFISNTLINYYWGGINQVHDLAGNFKAIRVKGILDKVDLEQLNVKGFVIQSTMIYELSKTGAKFYEIGAKFEDRRAGESKVGINLQFFKDILETIINATRIRIRKSKTFVKFGIVGFIGFLVNALFMKISNEMFGIPPGRSASIGAEFAIVSNFIWNNLWTFKKEEIKGWRILWKFIQFNLSSFGAVVIQGLVVGGLAILFGSDPLRLLIYLVIAIAFFIIPYNYSMYNIFIWKRWRIPFLRNLQKATG